MTTLVASQGERDHFRYLRAQTQQRVKRSFEGEMEREVHSILGPLGVDEKISRQVADCLLGIEASTRHDDASDADSSVSRGSASSKSWWRTGKKAQANGDAEYSGLRWSEDVGITTFLLKFGEGMGGCSSQRRFQYLLPVTNSWFLSFPGLS
jgi:hypothetical protein